MRPQWLQHFEQRKGRPLRVLHIGNIANNAFYNAKFLNQRGIQADVLCGQNMHIMASPEWEEADFTQPPKDQESPDWWSMNLGGYRRPRWFAQGPWELCADYLLARVTGRASQETLWHGLNQARRVFHRRRKLFNLALKIGGRLVPYPRFPRLRSVVESAFFDSGMRSFLRRATGSGVFLNSSMGFDEKAPDTKQADADALLMREFKHRFAGRSDTLRQSDLVLYRIKARALKLLVTHYDIVQAYGNDAIYPMLLDDCPYIAFEHGTLRDTPQAPWCYKGPFYDNALGRLTALAYARAAHVFVTNADNRAAIARLEIPHFSGIGHPFDEQLYMGEDDFGAMVRQQWGVQYLFVCPIRHDWYEKGVERYIAALPVLRQALGNNFKVLFMEYGNEIARSRRFIKALGCADRVVWKGPFGQVLYSRWLRAADVVFDQLQFASFSGTTPRGLAAGVPVIVNYDPQGGKWMFPEPPPVLAAQTVSDVVRRTLEALQPGFKDEYREKARAWACKHHSAQKTTDTQLHTYKRLLVEARRTGEGLKRRE